MYSPTALGRVDESLIEVRRQQLRDRVITKKDLYRMAAIIDAEYRKSVERGSRASIRFRFYCADGTMYESDDASVLEYDPIIGAKRVSRVEISYLNFDSRREIHLELSHGFAESGNVLAVQGDERDWVNGVFYQLLEAFSTSRQQFTWLCRHFNVVFAVTAISIGIVNAHLIVGRLLGFQVILSELFTSRPAWLTTVLEHTGGIIVFEFVRYALYWLSGAYPAEWLLERITALWPSIELQLGPPHTHAEAVRRAKFLGFLTIAVCPLLVNLASDLVQWWH